MPTPNIAYNHISNYEQNINCIDRKCNQFQYSFNTPGCYKEKIQRPHNARPTRIQNESRVGRKNRLDKTLSNNKARAKVNGRRFRFN